MLLAFFPSFCVPYAYCTCNRTLHAHSKNVPLSTSCTRLYVKIAPGCARWFPIMRFTVFSTLTFPPHAPSIPTIHPRSSACPTRMRSVVWPYFHNVYTYRKGGSHRDIRILLPARDDHLATDDHRTILLPKVTRFQLVHEIGPVACETFTVNYIPFLFSFLLFFFFFFCGMEHVLRSLTVERYRTIRAAMHHPLQLNQSRTRVALT